MTQRERGGERESWSTYLVTCLPRRAFSFAVQGLIMLSDGETYSRPCLVRRGASCQYPVGYGENRGRGGECGLRLLLFHLGLQDLSVVLHALNLGLAVLRLLLLLLDRRVAVLLGQDVSGRHCDLGVSCANVDAFACERCAVRARASSAFFCFCALWFRVV